MGRLLAGPGLVGMFLTAFYIWAVLDVILTDSMLVRNMQKSTWLFFVLFVPYLGAVAWGLFGRPEGASLFPGGAGGYDNNPNRTEDPGRYRSGAGAPAPRGLEDSSSWSPPTSAKPSRPVGADAESMAARERRLMEREAELARREAEIEQDRDDDDQS